MDITELLRLYNDIPPRKPRGSPENKLRQARWAKFQGYAKSLGLSVREAIDLCREKRESAGISPST